MNFGVMKWPGKPYVADRSQQGKMGKHVTVGPVQLNWYDGFRVYVTWPVQICFYAIR